MIFTLMKKNISSPKTAENAVFASTAEFMPIIEEMLACGQSVELSVRGKSMRPLLKEGRDSVILSPVKGEVKKYDIPLYKRVDGSYVIHRAVGIDGDKFTMAGDNQYVYERNVDRGQILALVTAIRRGDRLVRAESVYLRLYAKIWHHTRTLRHLPIRVLRRLKRLFLSK